MSKDLFLNRADKIITSAIEFRNAALSKKLIVPHGIPPIRSNGPYFCFTLPLGDAVMAGATPKKVMQLVALAKRFSNNNLLYLQAPRKDLRKGSTEFVIWTHTHKQPGLIKLSVWLQRNGQNLTHLASPEEYELLGIRKPKKKR